MGGLSRRRGIILSQTQKGQQIQVTADVPLAEMLGYIKHLRTVSAGRANYSMRFKDYALVPQQLAEQTIATI